METPTNRATADREIVLSRIIEGPRRLVFEAYTDAGHLSRWWGPNGFTTTTHSFDFRPGGVWDFTMHGPEGTDYPNHIEWVEITPPERIVMRHGSGPDDPDAFESTVTMVERAGGTEVTLRTLFNTKEQRQDKVERFGAIEGGNQTLAALDRYVQNLVRSEGGS